jgi:hypothetical protein
MLLEINTIYRSPVYVNNFYIFFEEVEYMGQEYFNGWEIIVNSHFAVPDPIEVPAMNSEDWVAITDLQTFDFADRLKEVIDKVAKLADNQYRRSMGPVEAVRAAYKAIQ